MLLATPFIHIDKVLPKNGPPRIISEIRKPETGLNKEQGRSRLSGDLLVKCANEQQWWPRRVMIRGGQLLVGCAHGDVKSSSLRISLRHLSLSAGALPNSISLIKGQSVLLTMQAASERAFDLWVKSIAIELIRQTPLEDVKYLDILTIADCWNRKESDQEKDWNFNCVKENSPKNCNTCNQAYDSLIRGKTDFVDDAAAKMTPKHARTRSRSCNAVPKTEDLFADRKHHIQKQTSVQFAKKTDDRPQNDESAVEVLIKKCQNPESYVPVKEKLVLFETLCRLGRKVRSTEDVSLKTTGMGTKRARSLHDLHSFSGGGGGGGGNAGVREICKYFENKTDDVNASKFATVSRSKRLIFSDTNLSKFKSIRNLQNVSHA